MVSVRDLLIGIVSLVIAPLIGALASFCMAALRLASIVWRDVANHTGRVNLDKQVVIVTGGAGGFGSAITVRLLAAGAIVWNVDVMPPADAAARLPASDRLVYRQCDLTDPAQLARLVAELRTQRVEVYALLNNAGITGLPSAAIETTPETLRNVFDVNFFAAAELSRQLFDRKRPLFKLSPRQCVAGQAPTRGRIVNVTSVAGLVSSSGISAYGASKFALECFTDATRLECGEQHIDVALIEPYFATTGIYRAMLAMTDRDFESSLLGEHFRFSKGRFTKALDDNVMMTADYVASFIERALTEAVPQDRYCVAPLTREIALRFAMHFPNYFGCVDKAKRDASTSDSV